MLCRPGHFSEAELEQYLAQNPEMENLDFKERVSEDLARSIAMDLPIGDYALMTLALYFQWSELSSVRRYDSAQTHPGFLHRLRNIGAFTPEARRREYHRRNDSPNAAWYTPIFIGLLVVVRTIVDARSHSGGAGSPPISPEGCVAIAFLAIGGLAFAIARWRLRWSLRRQIVCSAGAAVIGAIVVGWLAFA
jgi:hypothetical protein